MSAFHLVTTLAIGGTAFHKQPGGSRPLADFPQMTHPDRVKQQTDLSALIPETLDWNEGRGITPDDWISCVGNYELAVEYSLIFWPPFVAFEGYVLRSGFLESSVRGFEEMTGGNKQSVEAVMNHVHIADIHANVPALHVEQLRYLGRTLRSIYEAKLQSDFPDRRFVLLMMSPALIQSSTN